MRVVEPSQLQTSDSQRPKTTWRRRVLTVVFTIAAIGGISWAVLHFDSSADVSTQQTSTPSDVNASTVIEEDAAKPGELREFSGNEFRLLFDNLLQPNLDSVDTPPVITGDDIADARIREIAEERGYRLRSSPVEPLAYVQGVQVQDDVIDAWVQLQTEARQAGHTISITSAYRPVSIQRDLFLSRLYARGVSISQIANGDADEQIDDVLVTTALPGYSKHHTGYTIDILCSGYAFENFKNSPCFGWMSAQNYKQAKTFGFIPSYPDDADVQGPDPEAWEYVYVGRELLREE